MPVYVHSTIVQNALLSQIDAQPKFHKRARKFVSIEVYTVHMTRKKKNLIIFFRFCTFFQNDIETNSSCKITISQNCATLSQLFEMVGSVLQLKIPLHANI